MTIQGPKIGKCWELIYTIAIENDLWAIDFVKISYWAPKAHKYKSSNKKGPKGVQNPKIMTLQSPKIGKFWELIGTIAWEKV